jgi:plasmid stabilization system protein ParE
MTRSVELHPEAVAEARAARLWYAERSVAAAEGFMTELDHAVASVAETPERWGTGPHGTRRYHLRRYPYRLVYRLVTDAVQVIAVAHDRRRPGYWRAR